MEAANPCGERHRADASSEYALLEIRRRLCSAGHHVLRQVECEYSEGVVVLRGRVPRYYLKQLAQSLLLADPTVQSVVNLIEVSGPSRTNG